MSLPFPAPMAVALYFTIWWIVLFAVLPFGVRSQEEAGQRPAGSDPGAPVAPRLLAKAAWTTALSLVVFAGIVALANWAG